MYEFLMGSVSFLGSIVLVMILLVMFTHLYYLIKGDVGEKRKNKKRWITYNKFDREVVKPFSDELKCLEDALDADYMERVKERVLKDNPEWSSAMVDTGIVKLKHFLVMTKMFKNVPMFDDVADEVWHTMILFTRSYAEFCEKFDGGYIHHEPNIGKDVDPFELDRLHVMEFVLYGNMDTFKPKKDFFTYVTDRSFEDLSEKFINGDGRYADQVSVELRKLFDAMYLVVADDAKKNKRDLDIVYSPDKDTLRRSVDASKSSSNYTTYSDAAMLGMMIPIFMSSDVSAEESRQSHCSANTCASNTSSGGGSHCGSGGGSSCGSSCGGGCGS